MEWHRRTSSTVRLPPEEMEFVIDTARSMEEVLTRDIKKSRSAREDRGEPLLRSSTRTRTSFEMAGKRLSADVVNFSSSTSSVTKGRRCSTRHEHRGDEAEHPRGPALRIGRTPVPLPPRLLLHHQRGDGANEHPFQGLLDLYTILKVKGRSPASRSPSSGYPPQPVVGRTSIPREDGREAVAVRTAPSFPEMSGPGGLTSDIGKQSGGRCYHYAEDPI